MRHYGMNGAKGRARTLRSIRREREVEARADGVDPSDRAAFKAWDDRRFLELMDSLKANSKKGMP